MQRLHSWDLMTLCVAVALFFLVGSVDAWSWGDHKYHGHRVYRFFLNTTAQWQTINRFVANSTLGLEKFGARQKEGTMDLRIPSYSIRIADQTILRTLPNAILVPDLQDYIDTERAYMEHNSFKLERQIKSGDMTGLKDSSNMFKDYQSLDTISAFLTRLPGVTRVVIGKAYWGEEIPGEWIGPAMASWLVHFLVTNPQASHLLDLFTFHVIPVVNVEGYRFTRTHDRLWRKTLQPNPGSRCIGTDPNRNWDFAWSQDGASENPCTNRYQGPHPFSAPEPKALADYLLKVQKSSSNNLISYIDFHSYSQLWMYPNSFSCDMKLAIPERDVVHRAAKEGAEALRRVFGTEFAYGDGCNTIYVASGTSVDWAYYIAKAPYSYVVELRDIGQWGFTLPASEIVPSGLEIQAGILAMYNRIASDVYGDAAKVVGMRRRDHGGLFGVRRRRRPSRRDF
ncbi:Carboxypeptidase A4 [Dinochytrium kinnereticum]|nr:Carboxypeptidase A4 [Dinochytrium kinnereticum]